MSCLDFCTCTDFNCPDHPRHHNGECAPCIKKNLERKEIPACFWKQIGEGTPAESDYTFHKFAEKVLSSVPAKADNVGPERR